MLSIHHQDLPHHDRVSYRSIVFPGPISPPYHHHPHLPPFFATSQVTMGGGSLDYDAAHSGPSHHYRHHSQGHHHLQQQPTHQQHQHPHQHPHHQHQQSPPAQDSPQDTSVAQALEIARESPDGARDPTISSILEQALQKLWSRVLAQPESYVLTRDEFAVFNYFQHRFHDNNLAKDARRRYWEHPAA